MPKKFRTLAARTMSKASRARATKRTKTMLAEMHLNELRRARELSFLGRLIAATRGHRSVTRAWRHRLPDVAVR